MRFQSTLGLCGVLASWFLLSPATLLAVEPIEQQLNIRNHSVNRVRSQSLAEQLVESGHQSFAEGDYEAGITAWREAIEIYTDLGDTVTVEDLSESLAEVLLSLERYDTAEIIIQRRLAIAQDTNDLAGQIYNLNNLGSIYIQQGQIERAQTIFADALQIARETRDFAALGLTLSNLGLAAWRLGDLDSARTYYEAATNYRLQADDSTGLAHSSNSLAMVYRQLGEEGKALGAYLVARRTALEINHVPTLLTALDGLIDIYSDRGNPERLRTYIGERLVLTPAAAPPDQKLGLYIGLGKYYEQLEDVPRARAAYRQALELAEQIGDVQQGTYILNRLQALSS